MVPQKPQRDERDDPGCHQDDCRGHDVFPQKRADASTGHMNESKRFVSKRMNIWLRTCSWSARILTLIAAAFAHAGTLPATADGQPLPSLAPMLEKVTPAVVNIATFTTVQVRNPLLEDPFFRRFFNLPNPGERSYKRPQSAGSGVIVDARNGYVITNHHVIDRAEQITVTLADGRDLPATLVGTDPQVDLAVLKVASTGLTQLGFADSTGVRVGDFVIAIGNPFGLSQTVTSGIVSALGRSGLGIEGYEDFIQTDASINPGNSGGALVNLSGELVGLNTAILAPAGGNVGIGFAIPSNMVGVIMAQLIAHGAVRRGNLGMGVQPLNAELAEAFGVSWREGVVVVAVDEGGAADKAGIKPGDIVAKVGTRDIRRLRDFDSQSAVLMVGDRVSIEVIRDGKRRDVTAVISEDSYERLTGDRIDPRLTGVELENFKAEDDPSQAAGVIVTDVDGESPGYAAGLRPGDVIVATNRVPTRNIEELADVLRRATRQVLLRVYRNGQFGYIVIR